MARLRSAAMARIAARRVSAIQGVKGGSQTPSDKKEQKKSAKNHAPIAAASAAARKSGGM